MLKKIILLILIVGTIAVSAKSLRIESSDLASNLTNYKVLDTRSYELYTNGHIKGAVSFPIDLTYENKQNNGKLTNPIKMQEIIRKLGLELDSKIVIYDDGTFFDATRLF